jgi:hypothetical protein
MDVHLHIFQDNVNQLDCRGLTFVPPTPIHPTTQKDWQKHHATTETSEELKSFRSTDMAVGSPGVLVGVQYFYYFIITSGVGLSSLYCGHFWPIVPAPDDR